VDCIGRFGPRRARAKPAPSKIRNRRVLTVGRGFVKFLGSKTVLAVLAAMVLTLLAVNPASSASDNGNGQETCPGEGKVELEDGGATITVEAPDGEVVTGICLKAGSDNDNGNGCEGGLVNVELLEDDWAGSVTFVLADYGLTCGLSHYVPEFATTTTTVPETTTTVPETTTTVPETTTTVILSPTTTTTVPETTTTVILPPDETEGSDASDGTPTFTG